jgi:hypothetical protein
LQPRYDPCQISRTAPTPARQTTARRKWMPSTRTLSNITVRSRGFWSMKFLTDETICRPSRVHFCSDCLSVAFLTTISRRSIALRPTEPECSFPAFARQRIRHLVRIGPTGSTTCPWVPMVRASVIRSWIASHPRSPMGALMLTVGESGGCRFSRRKPFPGVRVAPGVALTMRGYLRRGPRQTRSWRPSKILEAV